MRPGDLLRSLLVRCINCGAYDHDPVTLLPVCGERCMSRMWRRLAEARFTEGLDRDREEIVRRFGVGRP